MRIYYSHDIFSSQAYGGISRYFVELIRNLPANQAQVEVMAGLHISQMLGGQRYYGFKVPSVPHTRFLRHFFNEALQKHRLDSVESGVYHPTYYFQPPPTVKHKKVVTIHDMTHEIFPQMFKPGDQTSEIKKKYCQWADQIIAVSQSTKNDLVKLFDIKAEKITVIHSGLTKLTTASTKPRVARPYFLFVGTRDGYKNFDTLLRAYGRADRIKNNFDLICFGGGRFNAQEKKMILDLKLADKVFQTAGGDFDLALYYGGARAFVFPSLYEGFGFPVLEAMVQDCPVVCSQTGSFKEVAGDAAYFFDPAKEADISTALETVLFSDSLTQELKQKGRNQINKFDWKKTAVETLEVYR